jgi:hypothetical protein
MNTEQIRSRVHDALHRGHRKATEEELTDVTAVVLAIVAEVTAELVEVIAHLAGRVEALEKKQGTG